MLPKAIKPGDTIGVIAPSNVIKEDDEEYIEKSSKLFTNLGYKVKFGKFVRTNSLGYGATAKERAEDINNMFKDKEVKAVICVKGGEDSNSTFDYIDYEVIKQISEEILSGKITQKPIYLYKNKRTACEFCSYKAICGFDSKICGNTYNFIPNLPKNEILEKLKGEM